MKILLIMPPTDLASSYGRLIKFSNPQPSIGIAYIAGVLRESSHEIKIIDAYVNCYGIKKIMDILGNFMPEIVGFSVLTTSADVVYELSCNIRRAFPNIKIVMGNIHASLFSDEILQERYADIVVHGEGEFSMLEIVNSYKNGGKLHDINGISFMENDKIVNTERRPYMYNLDALPFPAWDLFPMEKYATDPRTEVERGIVETQILATRGCPNECTFCASRTDRSQGNKYRMRTPALVVEEMLFMNERYGSKVFSFVDLAFPLVKKHAVEFCSEIIRRGLQNRIKWFSECRVKPLDEELFILLKKAGCVRVCFGIESGDNQILKALKKNISIEDVAKAVAPAKKAGLQVDGMFMIGLPGETERTINNTINFAIKLNLRYAIFNIFVPYPGCELWDILMRENRITFKKWSDFTSYPTYSEGVPVYVPDGLSKEKLMNLQRKAMKRFYLSPRFIINELRNFKIDKISHYYEGIRGLLSSRQNEN